MALCGEAIQLLFMGKKADPTESCKPVLPGGCIEESLGKLLAGGLSTSYGQSMAASPLFFLQSDFLVDQAWTDAADILGVEAVEKRLRVVNLVSKVGCNQPLK